ncbi:MAG: septum formation initiator family protein [Bacteroidia bacterium]|nr:septum formation initiator family protein [Bacteroidia bacterium]
MQHFLKVLSHLKNKYVITIIGLLIWMLFFDSNNFVSQYHLTSDLNQLENDRAYYLEEITKIKADSEELRTNMETLEKFAREKYFMKKDLEDIYIVVRE